MNTTTAIWIYVHEWGWIRKDLFLAISTTNEMEKSQ